MKKLISHPALLVFLLFGCDASPRRIDHVVKATVISEETVILLIADPKTGAIRPESFSAHDVVFYYDVPADGQSWAMYEGKSTSCLKGDFLAVHVRSSAEVEIGGDR